MRVLLTVPSLVREFGGPAVAAHHLRRGLAQLGEDAELIGCGTSEEAIGLPMLGRLHATPVPRSIGPLRRAVSRANVVHIFGYRDPVGTAAALFAKRAGIPYVLEPAGMHRPKLRSFRLKSTYEISFGRSLVRDAAGIIAASRLEADELIADGITRERVHIRPNGVSVGDLDPLPARGEFRALWGIPARVPTILYVGRLASSKGLPVLVEAVVTMPGVYAVIAGPDERDGSLAHVLRIRAEHSVEDRVLVFSRGLWGREKASAFADADCFCLPSSTESFGIAALEAAAVGLPVVASDRCGGTDWLDPAAFASFRHGDVPALRKALETCLEDPSVRAAAREAAYSLRDALDWRSISARQIEIYRATCAVGSEP